MQVARSARERCRCQARIWRDADGARRAAAGRCGHPGGRARALCRRRLAADPAIAARRQRARARRQDEARSQHRSLPASSCGGFDWSERCRTIQYSSPAPPASSAFMSRSGCSPKGAQVVGLDNVNDYYDPQLKEARLEILKRQSELHLREARSRRSRGDRRRCSRSIVSRSSSISRRRPACAIRCEHPHAYVDANLEGFINVLEGCRHNGCKHLAVRVVVVGLRRQHQAAVFGAGQCRSSDQPLCRIEEGQRADGAFLQPSVPAARRRACASSRSMARGAGPTWRCSSSPRRSSPGSRSSCSTTARCGAISPMSTTSARPSSA